MKKDTIFMVVLIGISAALFFASLFVIYGDANRYYPESGQYSPALLILFCFSPFKNDNFRKCT